jgi:hypothetical protein
MNLNQTEVPHPNRIFSQFYTPTATPTHGGATTGQLPFTAKQPLIMVGSLISFWEWMITHSQTLWNKWLTPKTPTLNGTLEKIVHSLFRTQRSD